MHIQKLSPEDFALYNRRLADNYGKLEDKPFFRLVWSEDILETRLMTHTNEGIQLLHSEVRTVPKYRHYIRDRYILEGMTVVPKFVETDLVEELSYEPFYTFEDKHGEYLIPKWNVIHFVIENLRNATENAGKGPKYVDPDSKPEEAIENQKKRIDQLITDLYGEDRTEIADALHYRDGVTVPHNFEPSTKGSN